MQLEDLWLVNQHAGSFRKLVSDRRLVADGAGLNVLIQATYQDEAMADAARAAVVAELDRRIAGVERELTDLGVDLAEGGQGA